MEHMPKFAAITRSELQRQAYMTGRPFWMRRWSPMGARSSGTGPMRFPMEQSICCSSTARWLAPATARGIRLDPSCSLGYLRTGRSSSMMPSGPKTGQSLKGGGGSSSN
jgi:hypothetical protein